ncbi:MAG TPA: cation diffusion facilitator family transporter [Candidatus Nanopelagicales bacterium]|nr:cation diffusion facilitator family transporter [Candidatus Nanopelagicales bacterium]
MSNGHTHGHGHGHGHGHSHGHGMGGAAALTAGARHRKPLLIAFLLTVAFVGVEFVAALFSGSLALLSDAGHMLTDAGGLGMALAAITLASAGSKAVHRTYGWYRVEILASLVNTLLLFGVAVYVMAEAYDRLRHPGEHEVGSTLMMGVAVAGLVINVISFRLLMAGAKESLNLRGAYLEVMADAIGSVGVLIGGAIIALTGWYWVDSVIAVGIGLFILPRAYSLGREAFRVLVESAPAHIDVDRVAQDLAELPGVVEAHDLHVWTITSGMDAMSVHLQVEPGAETHAVLDRARDLLRDTHHITHATVQIEPTDHEGCNQVLW